MERAPRAENADEGFLGKVARVGFVAGEPVGIVVGLLSVRFHRALDERVLVVVRQFKGHVANFSRSQGNLLQYTTHATGH